MLLNLILSNLLPPPPYMVNPNDEIHHAIRILIGFHFCKRQLSELKSCQAGLALTNGDRCENEKRAMANCRHENVSSALAHLREIAASTHCAAEIMAYSRCRQSSGEECQEEKLAAMRCASRIVVKGSFLKERALFENA